MRDAVVDGLLDEFAPLVDAHLRGIADAATLTVVAELLEVSGGDVRIDERSADKQPDWTYEARWDGKTPVERFTDHRAHPAVEP